MMRPFDYTPSGAEVWRVSSWLVLWAVIGTVAAVSFGAAFGGALGLVGGSGLDIAIGGAMFGLLGGPFFGIGAGLLLSSPRGGRSILRFAALGASVFGLVPIVLGLARGTIDANLSIGEILGGELFCAGSGAAFGALVGWVVATMGRRRRGRKTTNGWTELEL